MFASMFLTLAMVSVLTDPKLPVDKERHALNAIQLAGGRAEVSIDVTFKDATFGDKDLDVLIDHFRDMPNLRSLDLSKTSVTAAGLVRLKALAQLKMLGVSNGLYKHPVIGELQTAIKDLGVRSEFMIIGEASKPKFAPVGEPIKPKSKT